MGDYLKKAYEERDLIKELNRKEKLLMRALDYLQSISCIEQSNGDEAIFDDIECELKGVKNDKG